MHSEPRHLTPALTISIAVHASAFLALLMLFHASTLDRQPPPFTLPDKNIVWLPIATARVAATARFTGLDQQAIASARRWRFRPGERLGQPVPVRVTLLIEFNIR